MFKIVQADYSDLEMLEKFAKQTFSDTFKHYEQVDVLDHLEKTCSKAYFEKQLNSMDSEILLVKDGNVIIAYTKYGYVGLPIKNPRIPSLELHRLYVAKNHKNKGIGTTLMEHVIKVAKQSNCKSLYVSVFSENKHAIKFYQKYGFRRIGEYNYHVGSFVDLEYILEKELG